MTEAQIKHMIDRFLGWKLPADFNPDAGVNFEKPKIPEWWTTGTNLFTATQANAMIRYMTEGLPEDYRYDEDNCPGHVGDETNLKICKLCGIHIDSLRPPKETLNG